MVLGGIGVPVPVPVLLEGVVEQREQNVRGKGTRKMNSTLRKER